ncbi:MAG: hypothetical protein PF961_14815 [Planctomycetota bacterium]|jgi:hypothetical protein|nr:hypothetical protein [Planctomycetota bacterium]
MTAAGFSFDVFADPGLVWFRGPGSYSLDELIAGIMDVRNHPDFHPDCYTLVDFPATTIRFDPDGTLAYRNFFGALAGERGHTRWAIYSHMQETLDTAYVCHRILTESPIEVAVFEDFDCAVGWLNRGDPRTMPA